MITIREAYERDIDTIQNLAERTWWPSYGPILEKDQIEYMLQTIYSRDAIQKVMLDGSQKFLVLFEDDIPVGFASYGLWSERASTWKIFKLYVLPGGQGKGFGKKLLDDIVSRAIRSGIHALVLNVNRHNRAYHFYVKNGFSVLREEDIPIGEYWMNDFVMLLPL